jgi:hypothetical protein
LKQGNKQENERGNKNYEKYHATGGYRFGHRHRRQFPDGFWIRPNDSSLVLGVLGSKRPLPRLCPGLRSTLVDYFPPFTRIEAGAIFFKKRRCVTNQGSWSNNGNNQMDLVSNG